mgnify:CR=1 FL=1
MNIPQKHKRAVAVSFINHHNKELAEEMRHYKTTQAIYTDLIGGVYGEVRKVGSECELEIQGSESYTGYPLLFNFEA